MLKIQVERRMELEEKKISDEKLYWIQIVITVILGISTVFLMQVWWVIALFRTPLFVAIAPLRFIVVFLIYLIILLLTPVPILLIKSNDSLKECFRRPLNGIGTQILLYIFLCVIAYMINQ